MSEPDQHDSNPPSGEAGERRVHVNLRQIFEGACRIAEPFFDPQQGWGGMSLTMSLREAYPHLSQQEIAIMFSSVQLYHRAVQTQ